MTGRDDPRWTAFEKARDRELGRWNRLRIDAEEDVARLVGKALRTVQDRLAGPLSDWQAHHLPLLEGQLKSVLGELAADLGATVSEAATGAWAAGQALVEVPLAAAGMGEVAASLPRLDAAHLRAARSVLTDRMADVGKRAVERVNAQLAFAAMGVRDPAQVATEITAILGESTRKRALVITRTELGRVYSVAGQARQEQARAVLPGLRKQWRRSGKVLSRRAHDLADGQVVDVDKPFLVGGITIMHPRHPDAPAAHSINCGCLSLPFMASWEMKTPGRQAVSDAERAGSSAKRDLEEIHDEGFRKWAGWLADGKLKPAGSWEPVAQLAPDVVSRLAARGVGLVSSEVAISDRRITHLLRDTKPKKLPAETVKALPALMAKPLGVFHTVDQRRHVPRMVYIVEVPDKGKVGRVFVAPRKEEAKVKVRRHNYIVSADMVDRAVVEADERGGIYDALAGGVLSKEGR